MTNSWSNISGHDHSNVQNGHRFTQNTRNDCELLLSKSHSTCTRGSRRASTDHCETVVNFNVLPGPPRRSKSPFDENLHHHNELIRAAAEGQDRRVQKLLNEGASVNHRDRESCTALFRAVVSGHLKVVEILIQSGADVNARPNDMRYPLGVAKVKGYTAIATLLQECGAESPSLDEAFARINSYFNKPKQVPQHTPEVNAVSPLSTPEANAVSPLFPEKRVPICQSCLCGSSPTMAFADFLREQS